MVLQPKHTGTKPAESISKRDKHIQNSKLAVDFVVKVNNQTIHYTMFGFDFEGDFEITSGE